MKGRPQIGGKGKDRTGHGLGGAISRKESLGIDPTRCDHGILQQGQNHMPAAKHKRTTAIKAVNHGKKSGGIKLCQNG